MCSLSLHSYTLIFKDHVLNKRQNKYVEIKVRLTLSFFHALSVLSFSSYLFSFISLGSYTQEKWTVHVCSLHELIRSMFVVPSCRSSYSFVLLLLIYLSESINYISPLLAVSCLEIGWSVIVGSPLKQNLVFTSRLVIEIVDHLNSMWLLMSFFLSRKVINFHHLK